jgi:hypothetical protein
MSSTGPSRPSGFSSAISNRRRPMRNSNTSVQDRELLFESIPRTSARTIQSISRRLGMIGIERDRSLHDLNTSVQDLALNPLRPQGDWQWTAGRKNSFEHWIPETQLTPHLSLPSRKPMLNLLPPDLGMTANSYIARASPPIQAEAGLFRATKNLVLNQLLIHFAIISNP